MAKSLAEQIADLTKPKAEFDIEDSELKEGVFDNDSEGSGESEDEGLQSQHYVSVGKSKLRKDEINVGSKYTGSVSSRKDIYADDNDEEDEEEEEEEDDEEDDEKEVDLDDSELDEDEDEDQDEDSDMEEDVDIEADEDVSHKRDKLKLLLQQERKHIVSRLSQSASNEAIKGYSVIRQHKFFDSVLDSRIKFQKAISTSNQLPPNFSIANSEGLYTNKTSKLLGQSEEKCYELMDKIFALRNTLLTKDSIIKKGEALPALKPKKRSYSAYLELTEKHDNILNKYRSAVLTKWSGKIQTSSGASALNAGKFKAINQTSEQQVMNNLSDMGRLIKRTRLNRRLVKPMGFETYIRQTENGEAQDEEHDREEENPDIPRDASSKQGYQQLAELDIIFDDEDFYRVLLSDLVDKKVQTSNPASGMAISLSSAQRSQKLKKNIDNKASKGRKLRYHIQEPIANFEAPRGGWKWQDDQIDEFFASLLGQKVNMNEVDNDNEEDDEEEEEEVANIEGGIRLFG